MRTAQIIIALVAFIALAVSAHAERPIDRAKFSYDANSGYIFACVAPMNGKKSFKRWIEFVRLDDKTGKAIVTDQGPLRSTNARREKDAAAIYYEAKPWITRPQDDTACFLMAINPGRWVIGSVDSTVFALGSYGFDIEPGKITHIGTVISGFEDGKSKYPEIAKSKVSPDLLDYGLANSKMSSTFILRAPNEAELPPELNAYRWTLSKAIEDVRFQNYASALVGRAAELGKIEHQKPVPKSNSYDSFLELP